MARHGLIFIMKRKTIWRDMGSYGCCGDMFLFWLDTQLKTCNYQFGFVPGSSMDIFADHLERGQAISLKSSLLTPCSIT